MDAAGTSNTGIPSEFGPPTPRGMPCWLRIVKPPLKDAVPNHIDPAGQSQLSHRVSLVNLDGLDTDVQPSRDLDVAMAHGNQTEHFGFTVGELSPRLGVDWSVPCQ